MGDGLRFADHLHPRPAPSGIDVRCGLQHFAIVTYAVDPVRFGGLLPPRFVLDAVEIDGKRRALMSVVPFIDVDFTSAVFPFPKFTMGQTNYRIYVVDTATGERCVWFLGTTLDSWALAVPRRVWNLPWHAGRVRFDCDLDPATSLYRRYEMHTAAPWAPAALSLVQRADDGLELPGFPDLETGLVFLTHPLAGFYHRRDGALGTYRVWHERLQVTPARLVSARFGLLERLGLVTPEEQQVPHSVLVEPLNEFTIYLPPRRL
ncbi:hypothetical protein ASC87_03200 [Rhizobacter sp. Root1221]|nr:hypothetical protein ASC87_03200 [Rhizobacter sp. Root1221]